MIDEIEQKFAKIATDRGELTSLLNENRALRRCWIKNAADFERIAHQCNANAADGRDRAERTIGREYLLLHLLALLDQQENELRRVSIEPTHP